MDLLPPPILAQLDTHLRRRLGEVLDPRHLGPMAAALQDYVLDGGKRIRPQLCLWTMRHCAMAAADDLDGERASDAAMDVACAWELFHAFLLVHDDIIDAADERRRRPSLHRALAALDSGSPTFGRNLGIVAGDLLFAAAMSLWHEADIPSDLYRQTLRLVSRVALHTGVGQAADIVQSHTPLGEIGAEAILRGYHGKTAAYTFEGPMRSGAILGGADDAQQACLSRFAVALGQAYQLHNDLLDLAAPLHDGSDLVQGKRTLTLVQARALLDDARRPDLDARVAAIRPGDRAALLEAESVRRTLYAAGAVDATERVMAELIREARRAADDGCLPIPLGHALGGLLNKLRDAYFAPFPQPADQTESCLA